MDRACFHAVAECWIAADAVILHPNGFTYRLARSIGGAPRWYNTGRLMATSEFQR